MCNWSESHYLNGREDGEKLGMEKGEKLGIATGEKLGVEKEKYNVIHRMKKTGASIELIAAAVALSAAEVMSILS